MSDTGTDDDTAAPERPLGISLLTWLLGFWAGAAILILITLVFGEGPVMMSGRSVRRPEAVALLVPILAPMALAAAGAALALALGKWWSRSAVLLPIALAAVAPAFSGTADTAGDLLRSIAVTLPVAALVGWYLYGRPRVTAYFRALREGSRER